MSTDSPPWGPYFRHERKGKQNEKCTHATTRDSHYKFRLFISVSFEGEVSAWTNPGGTGRTSEGARGAILGFFCRVMPRRRRRRRRRDFIKRKCGNPSSDLKTFVVENNGGSPALDNGGPSPPLLRAHFFDKLHHQLLPPSHRYKRREGFFGAKKIPPV